jgi:hypothetical protein
MLCEEEWESYFGNIEEQDVSSDIRDIMRYLRNFDEEIAESECLRCWFKIYWIDEHIVVELVKEYITNETYYNAHEFETRANSNVILKIKASAEEYADMLIDMIQYEYEYKEVYGNRMNKLQNMQKYQEQR